MASHADDAAGWLAAARAGSADAVGQALDACRGYLLLIAQEELDAELRAKAGASDVVQQTLLSAWRDFSQFRGNSETELLAWLRQLLLHNLADLGRCYRQTRKREIHREIPLAGSPGGADLGLTADSGTPSRQFIAREETEAMQRALERLPCEYRQVLLLRYQGEKSFEEIGRIMGLTANAARKLWLRAIKRMRQESGDV